MAIHFACARCSRALFTQDHYAGGDARCPACQHVNRIPGNTGNTAPEAARSVDPHVVDMEISDGSEQPSPFARPVRAPDAESGVQASAEIAEGRRCPACAKSAAPGAEKCGACGMPLGAALPREQEHEKIKSLITGMLAGAYNSASLWRSIAAIVTTCTAGWLLWLTLSALDRPDPPYAMTGFNALMLVGLVWSTRQMKHGPPQVFLAAACAVMLCMPLDMRLGFVDADMIADVQRQNAEYQIVLSVEQARARLFWVSLIVGFLFSVPVWIAAIKVATLRRLMMEFSAKS